MIRRADALTVGFVNFSIVPEDTSTLGGDTQLAKFVLSPPKGAVNVVCTLMGYEVLASGKSLIHSAKVTLGEEYVLNVEKGTGSHCEGALGEPSATTLGLETVPDGSTKPTLREKVLSPSDDTKRRESNRKGRTIVVKSQAGRTIVRMLCTLYNHTFRGPN